MNAIASDKVIKYRSALYTLPITGILMGVFMVFVIGRPKHR
jgi:hypothetical protein